ncbi:MAG TPA: carboxypeptidase regulatory-like domain-containing protein [Actinomycetes bacterium]|jgi:hypothetical protein|nr:carboxypeptidase regulatory-like domain-containing protein [Actinomycetes bacterium]
MGGAARRALVAGTAAALLAAGCSSRTFDQVRGTVVDGRTGRAVAQAKVTASAPEAAEVGGTTDAQGRFTLHKVSKQARLKITSANYQPAEVQAADEALTVKLSPIPVTGVVSSTLTNRRLRATVGGSVKERTAADGSFSVYGLGPGDKLTASAPGYKTAAVTVDDDRRVAVALVAEEATRIRQVNDWLRAGNLAPVWRYVFRAPKGYEYEDLPSSVKDEARRQFTAGDAAKFIKGFDARSVTSGGAAADIEVLAFGVDPKVAALPGFDEGFMSGIAQEAGVSPQVITLAGGAEAAYLAPPGGPDAVVLGEGSLYVLMIGPGAKELKSFASAFVKAHE